METELTYEETELLIEARFRKYPELRAIIDSEHFDETLVQILDFEEVSHDFLDGIKEEIVIVLALYTPLNELAQNIQESTGLPLEKVENITSLIETLILQPVYNDLLAYQYLWMDALKKEAGVPKADGDVKEELELRPQGVTFDTSSEDDIEESTSGTLGDVPDASSELKEKLELRPPKIMARKPLFESEDEDDDGEDGVKPLTRTQILQSLSAKRTMASDIESMQKSDADTHT